MPPWLTPRCAAVLAAFTLGCIDNTAENLVASDPSATAAPGPGPNAKSASIYTKGGVIDVALTFDPAEWSKLQDYRDEGSKEYVKATFAYGNESLPAAVRFKSNPDDWDGHKPQFVIKFNEYDKSGRFHGLRRLVLEANPSDDTLCRNNLALEFMRSVGVTASRSNHLRLTIDGKSYGFYENIEAVDKEFLEDRFANSDGNLYENGGDELKTNEDLNDTSDLDALAEALDSGDPDAMDGAMAIDTAIDLAAAEAALALGDNYWAGGWNYYLYHEPAAGFVYIPWDLDDVWIDRTPTDADILTAEGVDVPGNTTHPLMRAIREHEPWRSAFLTRLAGMVKELEALPAAAQECCDSVRADVLADPNADISEDNFDEACAEVVSRAEARAKDVRKQLEALDIDIPD